MEEIKKTRCRNCGHPESHVPRFRVRVDTRRPGDDSRSGCRGFLGLVPQPLFMKSKVCSEEQTCLRCYMFRIVFVKLRQQTVDQFERKVNAVGCFGWYKPICPPPGSLILVIEPHRSL